MAENEGGAMTRELLELAQERIQQGWSQFHAAVDCNGTPVFIGSEDAVSWCIMGAMTQANHDLIGISGYSAKTFMDGLRLLTDEVKRTSPYYSTASADILIAWNDNANRNIDDVLQIFDRAINNSTAIEEE